MLEEYGNMAFYKASVYPDGQTEFPELDRDNPRTPSDIDFWNDIDFDEGIYQDLEEIIEIEEDEE